MASANAKTSRYQRTFTKDVIGVLVMALALTTIYQMLALELARIDAAGYWRTFGFSLHLFGCLWCMNHGAFHRERYELLPAGLKVGKKIHRNHHGRQDDMRHIRIPRWGWMGLSVGWVACGMLVGTMNWSANPNSGWWLSWLAATIGAGLFTGLYVFAHDLGHTHPQWRTHWFMRYLYASNHLVYHHGNRELGIKPDPMGHLGIYRPFQLLMAAYPVYSMVVRAVARAEHRWVPHWHDRERLMLRVHKEDPA